MGGFCWRWRGGCKHWRGVTALILDRQDIVSARDARRHLPRWAGTARCVQGDIFETLPQLAPDIVTANLFLHHLDDAALARLLALVAARAARLCRLRAAPLRLRAAGQRSWCSRWAPMTSPAMTRWPACAPGLPGRELSALWPQGAGWQLSERGVFPFTPSVRCDSAMRYDALVIGAGPAGSAAARLLAQAGWRVALVEKARISPPQGVRRVHLRHHHAGAGGLRRRRALSSPRPGRR